MILTTIKVARHPYEAMAAARERYGDPFYLPMANGKIVATARPELIKLLLTNREAELFGPFAFEATQALLGTHSVLMMGGAEHKRERKLLTPAFHGERMRAYGAQMIAATRAAFAMLEPGDEFVAIEHTTRVSLEAIVRAVFGFDDAAGVARFSAAIKATLDAAVPMILFSPKTQVAPFGLGPWARYQARSAEADALIYEQIERTRGNTEGREDILSLLLDARYEDGSQMSDSDIRDELRTLLIAGHETTAVSLAWALYALHADPEVLERARAEVDALGPDPAPDALARIPYLNALIDETLRLYPIVDVFFRRLLRPWSFAGYELPAGVCLCPAIVLVHRDPELYPDPERFDPERFMGRKPRPHEYLPFGGGNRRCIGAAFSHYESRLALATLLREFELELREPPGGIEAARRSVTMGPKTGVRMRVRARRG